MNIETWVYEEKSNEFLPETNFKSFTSFSNNSLQLYYLIPPGYEVLSLVFDKRQLVQTKSKPTFYFDLPAKDKSGYSTNAYWYLPVNDIKNVFHEVLTYDTFLDVDFDELSYALDKVGYVFRVTSLDQEDYYFSTYLNFIGFSLGSSQIYQIDAKNFENLDDIDSTKKDEMQSVIFTMT